MRKTIINYIWLLCVFAAAASARAQTAWDYFISDAGGGSSLVTWSVTGSFTNSSGLTLQTSVSSLAMKVSAPGIFHDSYVADGSFQSIPAPDGSYYQYLDSSMYFSIVGFQVNNAAVGGNDSFALTTGSFPPHGGDPGMSFLFNPGTESVLIPVDYTHFNPGTYQSQYTAFSTPVTVNLTVGPVPEPSTQTLVMGSCLMAWLLSHRRK